MKNTIDFENLIGLKTIFCGIDEFKFRIGNLSLEAIEDEEDGYRSCLQELKVLDKNLLILFRENVTICIHPNSNIDGIVLINDNQEIVLEIGTDNSDNYYPSFLFYYKPELLTFNKSVSKLRDKITQTPS
ncbi:MAG: hypothetical protein M0R17_04390 [Candidatus Omnitrophica bacterium]|jgi:hypothetical protein|nr:hypothetical protein [Candidatus Omnitrophota bacterium]